MFSSFRAKKRMPLLSARARHRKHRSLRLESLEPRALLAANVVINEIHYDPHSHPVSGAKTPTEFIELYNAGADAANLADWTLNKWWFARSPLLVASGITLSGSTATVARPSHGYVVGDSVRVSGAGQSQYNGLFQVTATTDDTFSYTVSGTPASPATGTIMVQRDVKKVTGFAVTGATATVTLANHGYAVGDSIILRDTKVTYYQELVTVATATANTFTCTLADGMIPPSTSVLTAQKAVQTMPGVTLGASSYLVLAVDAYGFRSTYPTVTGLVDGFTGALSNDGEKVEIKDAAGKTADKVTYKNEYPWPVGSNGEGPSMELVHPSLDNDIGGSWRTDSKVFTTMTASGTVATVTLAGHGYTVGDKVQVSGADQLAYDGFFTVTAATATTFSFTLASAPGTAATGRMLVQRVGGTPGRQNSVYAANAPPQTRQLDVSPEMPSTSQPATITIKATDPDGVASMSLQYQVVLPGQYIPANLPIPISTLIGSNPTPDPTPNPEYSNPARWTTVAMHDDGLGGDALAGDNIWTVVLPAQSANRTLVRYKITAADTLGASVTVPYADDPSLNFAYYVYNGVPAYQSWSADVMNSLPVYSVITRTADWQQMNAWNDSDRIPQGTVARFAENWYGTIVYDGKVYDNISYRTRGGNGRYQWGNMKRSMVYQFNKGNYFQAYDFQGNPYTNKWRTLTTSKGADNRGTLTWALNEAVNFYLFNQMGVPAPNTVFFHWRVVQGAQEAPDAFHGDFWGMSMAQEAYDSRFLDEHDLPDGNLYKLINQTDDGPAQERYQALNAVALNGEDHDNIEYNLTGGSTTAFINANVDMDEWIRYHAIVEAIQHYDYWPDANKNATWYFEPDYSGSIYGQMWTLPWDTDASWGPSWNGGQDAVYATVFPSHPEYWPAYYSAIREVRDLLWQPDQIQSLIDHFAAQISAFVAADYYRWMNAPADAGTYTGISPGGAGMSGLAALVQDMKNFAFVGGSWPGSTQPVGGRAAFLDSLLTSNGESTLIPNKPTITYAGTPGYPMGGLAFQTTAFSDPQGSGTFQAMEWQLATYTKIGSPGYDPTAPFKLELNADWESGVLTTFSNTVAVPEGAVKPGFWYRARVRMQDSTGRWSHWSAPVEFTVTSPEMQPLHDFLRVTELNYNPMPPTAAELAVNPAFTADDFEFLELINTSATQTLDLHDVSFMAGVTFDFNTATVTSMAPGDRILLVKNQAAFEARYGAGLRVAGVYSGNLSNSGEQLLLVDKYTAAIADFTYGTTGAWPGRADGKGSSLEAINTEGNYNAPANWQSSVDYSGSPGRAGRVPGTDVVVSEVLSHTDSPLFDSIELHNTTASAIDISGWYLSDANDNYKKYRIPSGSVLGAGQYMVFDARSFGIVDFAAATQGFDVLHTIEDTGATLHLTTNGWKRIKLPQTVGANTVLEFDFKSTVGGELQGIGLAAGDTLNYNSIFRLAGTGANGRDQYATYTGNGWVHYSIPLSEFAAAGMDGLVFANDCDANPPGSPSQAYFRNVNLHETGAVGQALDFNTYFGLNAAHGDDVYLLKADAAGNLVAFDDHASFDAQANGESWGRWQDDQGNWHMVPMRQRTLGTANDTGGNGPRVGPLVISEIMYAPKPYSATSPLSAAERSAGFTSLDQMEYLEIYNPTGSAVDLTHWRLDGTITYAFAAGTVLPARSAMLVVPFNPATTAMLNAFRAATRYNFGTTVKVVGPYTNYLTDTGGEVKLLRPDAPPVDEPTFYPGLLEDDVAYAPSQGAKGDGLSLSRQSTTSWGLNQSSWAAGSTSAGASGQVMARYLFYNNSAFDRATDDAAIATDKTALLPGGQASFANYTGYSRGINGVMVDIAGLASTSLRSSDFEFKVGNSSNLTNWTTLATAPSISARPAVGGISRVVLTWTDNTILNQWLQVTVKATANTGLAVADTFYFGNAVGETGNNATGSSADAVVDASDEVAVRAASTVLPASLTNRYDFNHDRKVNATDELLARANYRQGASALQLIDLSSAAAAAAAQTSAAGVVVATVVAEGVPYSVPSTQYTAPSTQYPVPSAKDADAPRPRPVARYPAIPVAPAVTPARNKMLPDFGWLWGVQQTGSSKPSADQNAALHRAVEEVLMRYWQ